MFSLAIVLAMFIKKEAEEVVGREGEAEGEGAGA